MSFFLSKLIGNTATTPSSTTAPSTSSAVPAKPPVLSPTSAPARSKHHLRVLLRGDKETGKSALLKRLQGGGFIEQHVVTPQITASNIQWSYKTSEESVSVEVWDVVDSAPIKSASKTSTATTPASSTLPTPSAATANTSNAAKSNNAIIAASTSTAASSFSFSSLPPDAASASDLYNNVHAVLFLIDPSRDWTFSYVKSQLPAIPAHIDVLLLLNFRDLPDSERGAVTCTTVEQYMRGVGDRVRYVECSMRNGYGLKHIHSFLNIPFLHLKREKLRQEIRELEREVEGAAAELELMSEMDYQSYCKWLSTQVVEQEKHMSEEERKINLEKRIQQERLMLLLADERKKDEERKATLIRHEKEKQQKEQERLQAEERKRLEKESKKKKPTSSSPSVSTAGPSVPSLVIDKAKERMELEKENLDDFQVEDNNDDFFGEPTTNPTVHSELQARQERTRPTEMDEKEDGIGEDDELDVRGAVANGLNEQKEREEEAVEDDDVLEEPAWELDEPVATYSSPFGVGGYGGGSVAAKSAEDREREKKEAREREREAEKERQREKEKERQRRTAEKRQKEEQREREMEERIKKEREEEAAQRAQQPSSTSQPEAEQDAFADENELVDDANTFRRPAKQYSFDDEDDVAAGPVFDEADEEDGKADTAGTKRPVVVLDDTAETSSEANKQTEVAVDEDELDMDFSSIHLREQEDKKREDEAIERRKRDERRQAQTSVLINPDAANIALPRLDLTYEDEVRMKQEEEEKQRREEEKHSLIFVPTATTPTVPDADLDIFGVAGGGETPRKEKSRGREKEKESRKGREEDGKRKGSHGESTNGKVALESFYGGLVPPAASNASSTASSKSNSPRPYDSKRDKKHSRVKHSDSERSNDSDTLDLPDTATPPHSKASDAKRESRGREKESEAEKGGKKRTVKKEGLEADLELDQPLDVAAEIEKAKKERDRKEREVREQERRKEKEKDRPKDTERERDGKKKSRRTAGSDSEEEEDEEERRRKKKQKERKKDRGDKDRTDRERGREKKRDESDRRTKRDEHSEEERSEDEDRKKKKPKERERDRGREREREKEDDKKKKRKKDKRGKHSDSDDSASSAEEERSSKPRKGRKKDAMDAFYDDDEAFASKRATAGAPAPVVVSSMGSHPAAGHGKSGSSSGGFFSNLLRSK